METTILLIIGILSLIINLYFILKNNLLEQRQSQMDNIIYEYKNMQKKYTDSIYLLEQREKNIKFLKTKLKNLIK